MPALHCAAEFFSKKSSSVKLHAFSIRDTAMMAAFQTCKQSARLTKSKVEERADGNADTLAPRKPEKCL